MRKYEKPVVEINNELAEGVYAASGTAYVKECDSIYMKGVWQAPDYSSWADLPGGVMGYKQYYGCLGCPANNGSGCAFDEELHYEESGSAASYDTDKGNRMPRWEKEGKLPDETVTDFGLGA